MEKFVHYLFLGNRAMARLQFRLECALNKKMIRNKKSYVDEIKALIQRKRAKFWGWKDPRNAFTVDNYLPHLDGDVYLICCFRKPDKILKSWKGKHSKELIDSYNRNIIKSVKKFVELED